MSIESNNNIVVRWQNSPLTWEGKYKTDNTDNTWKDIVV